MRTEVLRRGLFVHVSMVVCVGKLGLEPGSDSQWVGCWWERRIISLWKRSPMMASSAVKGVVGVAILSLWQSLRCS